MMMMSRSRSHYHGQPPRPGSPGDTPAPSQPSCSAPCPAAWSHPATRKLSTTFIEDANIYFSDFIFFHFKISCFNFIHTFYCPFLLNTKMVSLKYIAVYSKLELIVLQTWLQQRQHNLLRMNFREHLTCHVVSA